MQNAFMNFLDALKHEANRTLTENNAVTWRSSGSHNVDLFASIGALRGADAEEIVRRFFRAWAEDRNIAIRILFYARDIRGGLGERRVFRVILEALAVMEPESVRKNIPLIGEYGRYDDLLILLGTPCEAEALAFIQKTLSDDLSKMGSGEPVSLLAKWLPSVNASSENTRAQALIIAKALGMNTAQYRKTLSALRARIKILENDLRERDYSFDYAKQPSKAMFKYRQAFLRNDRERYKAYLEDVQEGKKSLHTAALMPYELVRAALKHPDEAERRSLDVTWNALEDYTDGRNALAVIDGSGSMYYSISNPQPADIALSLGIYFAERNKGMFHDHFITFSKSPRLVKIMGADFTERVLYCKSFNEISNTDLQAVFRLILKTAVDYKMTQADMPELLYIISDMEFDRCVAGADLTNFEAAKQLYEAHGYRLPQIVFWNVQSRQQQVPVQMNDRGVALVSGTSPQIFKMAMSNEIDPYQFMMKVIGSERYAAIQA